MARTGSNVSDFAEVLVWLSFTTQWAFGFHGFSFTNAMKRDAHSFETLCAKAVLSCDVGILWPGINSSVSCCQGREHVPRECGVHDVGKCSSGSRIKRVFPDRNIITVAERFHCAVSAAEFYAILSPDTGKCDALILLVAVQPFCRCPSLAALSSCRNLPLRSIYLLSQRLPAAMANTLLTLFSLPKACLGSPRFRVAPVSLRQCSRPAGRVFPAAYWATTRFLLHTTTCASTTLSTKSSGTCEAVVRYGVEASLGGVSDRAKRAACLSESVPVSLFYWFSGLVSSLGHVCSPNSQEDPARQKKTLPTFVQRLIRN